MSQRDQEASGAPTAFDQAAAELVTPDAGKLSAARYDVIRRTLMRYSRRFGLTEEQAEEVAADSITEVLEQVAGGRVTELREPGAYLFWNTRNRALDRRRRMRFLAQSEAADVLAQRPEHDRLYYSEADDELARFLDVDASAASIEHALRAASAAEDLVFVRVVTEWLNLAETDGKAPSSRDVAKASELSHTSVNQSLRRLRKYLPAQPDA